MATPRKQPKHTSLNLKADDQAALRELARALGYVQTRGPGKDRGDGSISALVSALARAYLNAPTPTREAIRKLLPQTP